MLSRITLAALVGISLSLAAVGVSEARQVVGDPGFQAMALGRAPRCDGKDLVLVVIKRDDSQGKVAGPYLLGDGEVRVLNGERVNVPYDLFRYPPSGRLLLLARPTEYPAGSGHWQLNVLTGFDGRSQARFTFDCRASEFHVR